jgi:ATP-dependent DNA helicase RecG
LLLDAVRAHPGIQAKNLVSLLEGRPLKTIERQVRRLIEKKLIERRGSRKTGGYYATAEK